MHPSAWFRLGRARRVGVKAEPAAPARTCPTHPAQHATANCGHCTKPICRECIAAFGYFCSAACREAEQRSVTPEELAQRAAESARFEIASRRFRLALWAVGGLVCIGLLFIVWKLFLDPAGRIAWSWVEPADPEEIRVLAATPERIVVHAGEQIATLNPRNGKVLSTFALARDGAVAAGADPDDADDATASDATLVLQRLRGRTASLALLEVQGDGLVAVSRSSVRRYDLTGKLTFEAKEKDGAIALPLLSADGTRLFYQVSVKAAADSAAPAADEAAQEAAALRAFLDRRVKLAALDAGTGAPLWSKLLEKGVAVEHLVAGARNLIGVFVWTPSEDKAEVAICALAGDTGKMSWRVKLPGPPAWGPVVADGRVLFVSEDELHAVSEDGEAKYRLPAPAKGRPEFSARGGLLFATSASGVRCYRLDDGKELWRLGIAIADADAITVTAERVFLVGEVEDGQAANLKLPPGLEEAQKALPEMGAILQAAAKRTVPLLVALNRETGQELWRVRRVYGTVVGDEHRLVALTDTAQTSMLEMATGGKGVTLVRQFNPRTGAEWYCRQHDIGVSHPVMVGRWLIGTAYERTRRPSLLGGMNVGTGADPQGLGIVAFRLK